MRCEVFFLNTNLKIVRNQIMQPVAELRKFSGPHFEEVIRLLDTDNLWRRLATHIPRSNVDDTPQYSNIHLEVLSSCAKRGESPALMLIDDWGTRGKVRPTIRDFYNLLIKLELIRIADYIAENVLQGTDPSLIHVSEEFPEIPEINGVSNTTLSSIADNTITLGQIETNIPHLPYEMLQSVTNNFSEANKIGEGTFGVVFSASLFSKKVAIKLMKVDIEVQFKNEVETLSKFKHPNLLAILSYSCNSPSHSCLVYEYMSNGNLQDCLACKNGSEAQSVQRRLNIAIGSARGIVHLHTSMTTPFVHRDIKSANILLDADWVPKVGDFGLVHIGTDSTRTLTKNLAGTQPYVAPEAWRGTVTIKMDTYSFGVVLLELLTGLAPMDSSREDHDLLTYVLESDMADNVLSYCDKNGTEWNREFAECLFFLAMDCIKEKKFRPTMQEVLAKLENLNMDSS